MAYTEDQVAAWQSSNPTATNDQLMSALGNGLQPIAQAPAQPSYTGGIQSLAAPSAMSPPPVTPPSPVAGPTTLNDLYQTVLGRAPDAGGLTNWQNAFGTGPLTKDQINAFTVAAAPELINSGYKPPTPTGFDANAYLSTNKDVADAYAANNLGLTPEQFAAEHYNIYGKNEGRLGDSNAIYDKLVKDAYANNLGLDPATIAANNEGLNYWKNQLTTGTVKPQDFSSVFNNAVDAYIAANPNDFYSQKALDFRKTQTENTGIKDYATSVFGDTTLSAADQANKIIDQARQNGFDQTRLEKILGKDKVQPLYDTYKKNINDFLTTTLAQEPGTTMNEVGAIHKQAVDRNMTVDDFVKYGGLDKNTAQSYFDMYDKGLGSIVSQLNDSKKYDDVSKTQNLLALQQKYGTTDAELAKATGGKTTTSDIKSYLDPIRNLQTDLQKMMTDNSYTAEDVQKKIDEARKDPRASGIFGTALDKISQNMPAFVLRDAQSGNKDLVTSYQNFLTKAKATPETAAKYAPQIATVENILKNTQYSANEVFGGKTQNYQLQLMSSLTDKAKKDIPQQLEFTPVVKKQGVDEDGNPVIQQTGGYLKSTNVDMNEDGTFSSTKPVTVNGEEVYANYDTNGKLTGYSGNPAQATWLDGHHYITGKWDAQGNAKPAQHGSYNSGFIGNALQDMGSNPLGMLMLAAATGGLGGLLGGGALGAAGAGGIMAGLQGQDILKGALGGGLGNLAGGFVGANLPTGGFTDNSMINGYLNSALPKAAGAVTNSAITGGNVGQAGLTSLVNTGVNSALNPVFNNLGLEGLPTNVQPYVSGIGSNLITSSLTGKPVNVQNAVMNTVLQQAMNANKMAARP